MRTATADRRAAPCARFFLAREAVLPPLSLYLHYPWCIAKCPYCDFNSHERKTNVDTAAYLRQLVADIRESKALAGGRPLASVYFGGGTPSLMSAREVTEVLAAVEETHGLPDEITLESNPGSFEQDKFEAFRAAGITRLSIGVQSFQDDKLRSLGRVHGGDEALRAASSAVEMFDRVNVDLMYGLPAQTAEDALSDLETACSLGVGHLSWYQLTIEPRTVFHRRPPLLPVEAEALEMEAAGLEKLDAAGFRRYEISAFAKDDQTCQHNLNYWQFGDYLGVGAGAHGKLTSGNNAIRTSFARQPRRFSGEVPDRFNEAPIAEESLPVEFMMNALRLIDGVDEELFEARTGIPLIRIQETLGELRAAGLMRSDRLGLTAKGLRFLDSVVGEFLEH